MASSLMRLRGASATTIGFASAAPLMGCSPSVSASSNNYVLQQQMRGF